VGELRGSAHLSEPPGSARTQRIASLFSSAGVPCQVSNYIEADLWSKFIFNCAGNAVTAIAQTSYAQAARNPESRELMGRVIAETVAVARASGVQLPDVDLAEMMGFFQSSMGEATSSTAQDLARGKRTEIDTLNGYVNSLGKKFGVATPANFALYALVKLLEEKLVK
jgi:2-dehydropantoate 2-reductase